MARGSNLLLAAGALAATGVGFVLARKKPGTPATLPADLRTVVEQKSYKGGYAIGVTGAEFQGAPSGYDSYAWRRGYDEGRAIYINSTFKGDTPPKPPGTLSPSLIFAADVRVQIVDASANVVTSLREGSAYTAEVRVTNRTKLKSTGAPAPAEAQVQMTGVPLGIVPETTVLLPAGATVVMRYAFRGQVLITP